MEKHNIVRSKAFVRAYEKYVRKLNKKQFDEVSRRLILFEADWHSRELKTHKSKNAGNRWAFTVLEDADRSDRAVFIFAVEEHDSATHIRLLNIGPHDLMYRDT